MATSGAPDDFLHDPAAHRHEDKLRMRLEEEIKGVARAGSERHPDLERIIAQSVDALVKAAQAYAGALNDVRAKHDRAAKRENS